MIEDRIKKMEDIGMEKRISGHTGLLALIGSPVGHSGLTGNVQFTALRNSDWTMPMWHLILKKMKWRTRFPQ